MLPNWYTEPQIIAAIFMVCIGFYLLIKGADFLVDGSVIVANKFSLSPAVIGATVVAFGTSMPELVVSIGANLKAISMGATGADGPAAIAVGNVVGSNIFNIAAILGIMAIMTPLKIPTSIAKFEYPLMILSLVSLILFSFITTGEYQISRIEGILLFLGLVFFTYYSITFGKVPVGEIAEAQAHHGSIAHGIFAIVVGILMLCIGGEVTLNGALSISKEIGLSERVIGLTVMAVGTSLPELVTSIQAVRKKETDMAIGNIVGSNLFNIFSVIGITSMIIPLPVSENALFFDYWWMLGFSLVIFPFILMKKSIGRKTGVFFVITLISYISIILCS